MGGAGQSVRQAGVTVWERVMLAAAMAIGLAVAKN